METFLLSISQTASTHFYTAHVLLLVLSRILCAEAFCMAKHGFPPLSSHRKVVMQGPYIDIAVNLADGMYKGIYNERSKHPNDVENVLRRAKAEGVRSMIILGGNLQESQEAIQLCRTFAGDFYPSLSATVGVHPTRSNEFLDSGSASEHLEMLKHLAVANKDIVVAIGEIGLDFDRTQYCSIDVQQKYFEYQLQLVEALQLPMFLHMRAASKPFCETLRRNLPLWRKFGGVVHSFTGTIEELDQLLALDLFIGINGCSLKTEENLQAVERIPIHKLLLETDAPWCGIRPTHASYRYIKQPIVGAVKPEKWKADKRIKNRSEPADISQVAEVVYKVKKVENSFESFCQRIMYNAQTLFPQLVHDGQAGKSDQGNIQSW